MASFTSPELVRGIITVSPADDDVRLQYFIDTAHALVTNVCIPKSIERAIPTGAGYNDETSELIERWLSAHFYAVMRNRASNENADVVGQGYQYYVNALLENTMYGAQAMILDIAGGLNDLQRNAKNTSGIGTNRANVLWLGK